MNEENNYCQDNEAQDDVYFKKWTNLLNWWPTAERSDDQFDRIDYRYTGSTGTVSNIELKGRDGNKTEESIAYYPAYFSGIFIEKGKYEHLMKRWEENKEIPVYINFFNSGNTVVIYDLRKAEKLYEEAKLYKVWSGVKKAYEWVQRYELTLKSAAYVYNYFTTPQGYKIDAPDFKNWQTSLYKKAKQDHTLYEKDPYYICP